MKYELLAKAVAERIHRHQKYGEFPYIYHVEQVVWVVRMAAEVLNLEGVELDKRVAAAYLHDTVEDTEGDVEELISYLWLNFPADVVHSVLLLSKNYDGGKDMEKYVQRIVEDDIAFFVKLADNRVNHAQNVKEGNAERAERYNDIYIALRDARMIFEGDMDV